MRVSIMREAIILLLFVLHIYWANGALLSCYYSYPVAAQPTTEIDANLCNQLIIFGGTTLYRNGSMSFLGSKDIHDINIIRKKNPNLVVTFSLLLQPGEQTEIISALIASKEKIQQIVAQVVNFLNVSNFDGFDLDWEFPVTNTWRFVEKEQYISLLKEFRASFDRYPRKFLLTAAVTADFYLAMFAYDIPEMNRYVDYINLMCYDFRYYRSYFPFVGYDANLFPSSGEIWPFNQLNTASACNYWHRNGMAKSKILVGIPTYARAYTLWSKYLHVPYSPATGPSKYGTAFSHSKVCQLLNEQFERVWDDNAKVPYCYKNDQWVSFDDLESVALKANWIKKNKFAGAVIFDMYSDDFKGVCRNGSTYPLTRQVKKHLAL